MALLRAVVTLLALASAGVSAEVHHVAGGWGPDLNVTAWLLGRVFLVGDKLWFESSGSEQAVVEMGNAHDFDTCNVANPLRMYTDDRRVSLDREGMRYFASADPEMCRSGLKLPVIVHPLEDDPFRPHPWPTPEHFQPPSEHESPPWVDPPVKPEPHPPEWPTPEHFQPPSEHESPPWVDPPVKPEPHPPEWPTPEHFPPPSEYEPPPWVDPPVKPEPHPPEWPAPEHFQPPSEYEPPPWVEPPFKPEPPPYVGPVYPPEHRPPPPPPPPPSPPPPSPPSAASYISGPSFMFLMGGLVLLF